MLRPSNAHCGHRGAIKSCACAPTQRVIRLQPSTRLHTAFPPLRPGRGGRDQGNLRFEFERLNQHIGIYPELFRALAAQGLELREPLVELTDFAVAAQSEITLVTNWAARLTGNAKQRLLTSGFGTEFVCESTALLLRRLHLERNRDHCITV